MPTQKGGYYLADGTTRVPSVTTVCNRFKDAGGLIHWAWKEGSEGRDYRETRDKAADAGTMAHAAVDAWIHSKPIRFDGDPDVCGKAKTAFGAFLSWTEQTQLRVTHTEIPLVSEAHKFGGTFDAVVIRNGRAMADWKTSNAVYTENLIQLAAYGALWNENFPDDPIVAGNHLLRFDKEFGDFHHHYWADLSTAWDSFLHMRRLYENDKELKRRAK